MKIGFVGLGRMGNGMVLNMLRAKLPLIVFDLNAEAMARASTAGAELADSIAELAQQADVIFTSLPGPQEVEAVVLRPGGILENMRPAKSLFDLSTNAPATIRKIGALAEQKGAYFFDAPVSGGPAGAASGDLVIWIGGDRQRYDAHLSVLESFANHPRHVGALGAGTVIKLCHNMFGATLLATQAEIFSLGVKAGIDPLDLWEALKLGVVGKQSPLEMLTKQFLPGEYDKPAFAQKLALKDVRLGTELARELAVPMRIINTTFADMTEAVNKGMGDQDSRAFMKLQLERAGVSIAVAPERIDRAINAQKR
ncbi:NAD(P)-dependent oxidoreductase [Mesorhizobium sp. A556]